MTTTRLRHNDMMTDPPHSHFALLSRIGDINQAQLIAARLDAEGIEARVHSPMGSVYPVTVGGLAETEIWVPIDQMEAASRILLDAEVNDVLERTESGTTSGLPWEARFAAGAIVIIFMVLWILRLVEVWG